jgi:hypothetical protein
LRARDSGLDVGDAVQVRLWEVTAPATLATDSGWMTAHPETIRMDEKRLPDIKSAERN